jgi:hypothetical protein
MKRMLGVVALGAAGLVLAVALSMGAFALAGRAVGEPATAIQISTPAPSRNLSDKQGSTGSTRPSSPATAEDHSGSSPGPHAGGESPSEPGDDHGGRDTDD